MDDGQVDNLSSIDKFYSDVRWNNQFHDMDQLPVYLQEKLDSKQVSLGEDRNSDIYPNSLQNKASKNHNENSEHSVLERNKRLILQTPEWHKPWKLRRVINGHLGWVRCIEVDTVENKWFATGSSDTTIKIWDLEKGTLKITLTGHLMPVKDLAISNRSPYLFSASEDKLVKCWDLEKNMCIRDYFGHLSGVNTVDIHPTLDLVATAGRDSTIKLWDIRTRVAAITLVGHKAPIMTVKCAPVDPQVISSSNDGTIKLWDIIAGKAIKTLTHHKRAVRTIALNQTEFSFASACRDDIRSWRLPEGSLLTNFSSESLGIINSISINQDNILAACGNNGVLSFFDYNSGHKYQTIEPTVMHGSLESERGILCSNFDKTGSIFLTGETDKSIKVWSKIEGATPETHPGLGWNPLLSTQRL